MGAAVTRAIKPISALLPAEPEYLAYIYAALTEQAVAQRFGHFIQGSAVTVG